MRAEPIRDAALENQPLLMEKGRAGDVVGADFGQAAEQGREAGYSPHRKQKRKQAADGGYAGLRTRTSQGRM